MNKLNSIIYRGQRYDIRLIAYAGKSTQVVFREDKFYIYVNNKLNEDKVLQAGVQQLRFWMLEKAEEHIKQRTAEYGKIIGVSYNTVRIKDTRSRWGSCSSKGNLNFNFRIIMAPQAVMDYIIIHELCHLLHMNHSKAFWSTVAQYMPDYEKQKEWLKKNGAELYIL